MLPLIVDTDVITDVFRGGVLKSNNPREDWVEPYFLVHVTFHGIH